MRKEKPPVTLQDLEQAVSAWEEAILWIAKGWDCIEEYTHDLYSRETLDALLTEYGGKPLPAELIGRIVQADQSFREISYESDRCVWSDARNYEPMRYWYYYRWQRAKE